MRDFLGVSLSDEGELVTLFVGIDDDDDDVVVGFDKSL